MPKIETLLAQAGRCQDARTGAISTPIYQSATFEHPALGQSTGFDYSRSANPTRSVVEQTIAALDHGCAGFAFASGLAALNTVFSLFSSGDHLVVAEGCYGGSSRLLDQVFSRFGLSVSYVAVTDTAAYQAAIRPNTRAILVESLSNPCLHVPDLPALAALARQHNLLFIVDNTFLTPFWLKPLDLGADLVVHSASKYLGGHNDVLAGLVSVRDPALAEKVAYLQNAIGAVLGPQDAWLLLRGMKTLALRLERQQQSAQRLADWLTRQPQVRKVLYPGLSQHPGHDRLQQQASGFGAMISFELANQEAVARLIERLNYIAYAESLGGVESLITVPAIQTHANLPVVERARLGVGDALVRLSVGIEAAEDLQTDLAQALA
ncbi:MAG: cystathionine gamma-synthase [Proteobacteria bacterium]|nr:cystathionine gamma-synthase [Pseudomonadota bacterium]